MPEYIRQFDCIVIGGGVSGLAAAWGVAKEGRRVLLLEKGSRPGGVIQSDRVDGFLLERGPNSYTSFGPEEDNFLSDIGLGERVLRRPLKTTDRFVWHSGKLHRVPTAPPELLFSSILPFSAKLRILRGMFSKYNPPLEDVKFGSWLRERVGDTMVETLAKPFFGGVYAADVDEASFAACAPKIFEHVQNVERLIKVPGEMKKAREAEGRPRLAKSLTSFPEGLSELPAAIARRVEELGGVIRCEVESRIEKGENSDWVVRYNGETALAPHVIVGASAYGAADGLEQVAPKACPILRDFPAVDLNVVHAGLKTTDLAEQRNGFGFLTRRGEGVRILGSIWNSRIFDGRAPKDKTLLTCFYGGQLDPEANELSDEELASHLREDLRRTMGWSGQDFDLFEVTRWRPALPLYRLGHAEKVARLLSIVPEGIHILGNYLGRPAMPDRIRKGWEAAEKSLVSLEKSGPALAHNLP